MPNRFAILLFLLIIGSSVAGQNTKSEFMAGFCPESLVQVIANPKHFDNKLIGLTGFLSTGYEDDNLYLSPQDAEHFTENRIGIAYDKKHIDLNTSEHVRLHHTWVTVVGKFSARDKTLMVIRLGSRENDSPKVSPNTPH